MKNGPESSTHDEPGQADANMEILESLDLRNNYRGTGGWRKKFSPPGFIRGGSNTAQLAAHP
jgi:hypothetical protein